MKDWVGLAVSRARASGSKAIFWLDPARAHDRNIVDLATRYLLDHDTKGTHQLLKKQLTYYLRTFFLLSAEKLYKIIGGLTPPPS